MRINVNGVERVMTPDEVAEIEALQAASQPTLAQVKAAKLAELDDYRWQVEVGGADFGGVPIRTDANSQAKITAAWALANADPGYYIPVWEVAPGVFWPLPNETILAMAAAVRAHVQETFNRKAVLYPVIQDLSTIEAVQAFDVATQWVEYTLPVEAPEPEPEPEEGEAP